MVLEPLLNIYPVLHQHFSYTLLLLLFFLLKAIILLKHG